MKAKNLLEGIELLDGGMQTSAAHGWSPAFTVTINLDARGDGLSDDQNMHQAVKWAPILPERQFI